MKTKQITCLTLALAVSSALNAATITGTVTNTQGQPVADAEVTIEGTNLVAFTQEDGSYRFENIDPSHVHLHVYSTQYVHGDKDAGKIPDTYVADFVLKPSSIENIVVHANSLQTSVLESVTPVSVLNAETLRKKQAPTLGETLKNTPGVHATYFGPVASSPIIRGTDGPRVKIVQNGLDVSDASRIGPDHNVAVDVASAQQVEVLRGPATLQYGSGAIGGVVNVVDNRIPTYVPEEVEGEAEVRYETAGEELFGKIDLTGGAGKFAWHVDAFDRDTDDYNIPGFAEEEPHEDDESGTLEGSAINTSNIAGGISYVDDAGYIGFSMQQLENFYGVPGHGHAEEEEEHEGEEEEEAVNLDVDMERYQLAGELFSPFEGISSIQFKAAYTDYEHVEIEGDEIGTIFTNETTEGRLNFHHEDIGGWHGVIGLHFNNVEFSAVGEEAYTPPNETDSYALYILEEKRFDNVTVQLGGRIERTELEADPFSIEFELFEEHHDDEDEHHDDEDGHEEDEHGHEEDEHGHEEDEHAEETFVIAEQSFTSVSLSAGLNWEYTPGYSLAVSVARSERAPSHQELFSAGNHISTQTYDLGLLYTLDDEHVELSDKSVEEEVSTNIDVTWRKFTGDWSFTASVFYNQVDDYIFQANTGLLTVAEEHGHGEEEEELEEEHGHEEEELEAGFPVFRFFQEDADIYGFEFETNYKVNDIWQVSLFGDYIKAEVDSDDLPRIPPLRLGTEFSFEADNWYGDLEIVWYDEQDDISEFETITDSYTMVNLSLNYQHQTDSLDWTFFTRLTNLTDEEGRVHSSFLKDRAPLPGRGLTMGVRATF